MILLTSNSLNGRHRELNSKVNEAATHGVLFEDVKLQTEKSDVDRLYKIKLADKYRNVEYIIDTLKCGDDLYISKALKCAWICDEEFSNIINPDYLEKNIFPEMSFRMKRKLLTMISMHVTNDRAASFYTYCMQTKLTNIALKFLLNTTEAFKLDVINGGNMPFISDENIIDIIGKSFSVAVAVLETLSKYEILKYLHNLRYLYSVSNVEYLDLVEKYTLKHELTWEEHPRLGLRISTHIVKNYKDRILSHTLLYINMLNKSMLVKYSRPDDVKCYALRLLPAECSDFWSQNFFGKYNFLLELIPFQERLQYIKHIFTTRYPKEDFEMDIRFYEAGLYTLMTEEQRESWALKHVENELEHFGSDKDFLWYKFVSFEKAFLAIKKFILVAAYASLRNQMVCVLIHSAKSNRDLEILFDYYYKRHVNENKYEKEVFVDEVLSNHKYYNFDDDCWNAFNKILHSMDVYDSQNYYYHLHHQHQRYMVRVLIYSIIHEKELHIVVKDYIDAGINLYILKQATDELPEGKAEVVYQYLFNYYLGKINEFDINKFNAAEDSEMKKTIRKNSVHLIILMKEFDKSKLDIPEIVKMYAKLDFEYYKDLNMFIEETAPPLTQDMLLKDLKTDASLVVSKISSVRTKLKDDGSFRLNKLLCKIRVYFSTEVAIKYMELFKDLLISEDTSENTCNTAVYGIFQLAENDERIEFVTKYTPTEPKIAHDEIKRKLLYIRKAVCKCVGMSRPVVSLVHVKKYIVGDYLKFCLPLMQSYAANLKPALFAEFVTFLLKSPASVQKHGIRLAFHCFNIKDLKEIISQTWDSTKNVSLRLVMYQAVHDKIIALSNEDLQTELFEIFNSFTLSLREDDNDEFLEVLCKSDLPHHILGEHIFSGWKALNHLPDKQKFNKYKCYVVNNMIQNVHLLQQDVLESIVSEHITFMLKQGNIKYCYNGSDENINNLIEAKWNLTAKYIVYFPNKAILAHKIKIIQTIIQEFVRLWDKIDNNVYIVRQFLKMFVDNIIDSTSLKDSDSCLYGISLLEEVLNELQEALPLIEIYDTVWSLRLSIIARNIILTVKDNIHDADVDNDNENDIDGVDADNKQIFNNCVDRFANEFNVLFNEFIERGNYYLSGICIGTIITCVSNVASSLLNALSHIVNKNTDDILLSICSKLIEIEKLETYYFALELLPQNYYVESSMFRSIVNKMKSFDNAEIRHFLYRKLVCESNYECQKLNAHSDGN